MAESDPLAPLLEVLRGFKSWLEGCHVNGVIIGGIAASILGRPRATRDVDALILLDDDNWESFVKSGAEYGFTPRLSDCIDFARKSRVLLLKHGLTGTEVDISIGQLEFEQEVVSECVWIDIEGVQIPVATPENLIIMKALAGRSRDIADIESLAASCPTLDEKRIYSWLSEIGRIMDMPELVDETRTILAKARKGRR